MQHEVLRGIPADLAAEYLAGRLGETNAVAARHVALATSLVGRGGEGADLSQCVAAFTMPDGTLELHHLSVRRRADARYDVAFMTGRTSFKLAPDIAILYHTTTKKSFLSSSSSTTIEFRELERPLRMEDLARVTDTMAHALLAFCIPIAADGLALLTV